MCNAGTLQQQQQQQQEPAQASFHTPELSLQPGASVSSHAGASVPAAQPSPRDPRPWAGKRPLSGGLQTEQEISSRQVTQPAPVPEAADQPAAQGALQEALQTLTIVEGLIPRLAALPSTGQQQQQQQPQPRLEPLINTEGGPEADQQPASSAPAGSSERPADAAQAEADVAQLLTTLSAQQAQSAGDGSLQQPISAQGDAQPAAEPAGMENGHADQAGPSTAPTPKGRSKKPTKRNRNSDPADAEHSLGQKKRWPSREPHPVDRLTAEQPEQPGYTLQQFREYCMTKQKDLQDIMAKCSSATTKGQAKSQVQRLQRITNAAKGKVDQLQE